jgi:hypothetical protein
VSDRGFTLVEAVVAVALTVGVVGALVGLVAPDSHIAEVQPEAIDVQQRARVGADLLTRDLFMAGAGPAAGPQIGSLAWYVAPVLPRRVGLSGADPYTTARPDAITLAYIPPRGVETTLGGPLGSGAAALDVDPRPGCPIGRAVCGFEDGMNALVFDDAGNFDFFAVTGIRPPFVDVRHLGASPSLSYRDDAAIVQVDLHSYYFDRAARQLRHYDGDRSDVPVIDNVVGVAFEYFGDPAPPARPKPAIGTANCLYDAAGAPVSSLTWLSTGGASLAPLPLTMFGDGPWCGAGSTTFDADVLRIRKIRVTLRVQAAHGGLRGRGPDFATPGWSRTPVRSVPDYSLTFDVSPRNLNLGR